MDTDVSVRHIDLIYEGQTVYLDCLIL